MYSKFTSTTLSYLEWAEKYFVTKKIAVLNKPHSSRFVLLGSSTGEDYIDKVTSYSYASEKDISLVPTKQKWAYGTGYGYNVNSFYFKELDLAAGDSVTVNFYSLTKPVLNYNLTQIWNRLKVVAIENTSGSGNLDIGVSGLANPVGLFGYDTEVGASGIYTMESKVGIEVSSSANSIRVLNRNSFAVSTRIFAMGNKD